MQGGINDSIVWVWARWYKLMGKGLSFFSLLLVYCIWLVHMVGNLGKSYFGRLLIDQVNSITILAIRDGWLIGLFLLQLSLGLLNVFIPFSFF